MAIHHYLRSNSAGCIHRTGVGSLGSRPGAQQGCSACIPTPYPHGLQSKPITPNASIPSDGEKTPAALPDLPMWLRAGDHPWALPKPLGKQHGGQLGAYGCYTSLQVKLCSPPCSGRWLLRRVPNRGGSSTLNSMPRAG